MARTPIHPGEHLADDLTALGMSASAFADVDALLAPVAGGAPARIGPLGP